MPSVLAVIPARYRSTRFPGKILAPIGDRTMLEEVWRRSRRARKITRLVVATDDERIAVVARTFGAEVLLTSPEHASGTDRVAEVVGRLSETYEIVLNIQGDEPLLTPTSLDSLIEPFECEDPPEMATLSEPLADIDELFDPNVVKIVATEDGRALYFSRCPIPYHRGMSSTLALEYRAALSERPRGLEGYLKHPGIYAYTRAALLALTARRPSTLELDEGLEQLRALQAGYAIQLIAADFRSLSVDTPADLEQVKQILTEAK